MTSGLQKEFRGNDTLLIRSMDEYLALKHGTGTTSLALAALLRDRYGDDCSVFDCGHSADVVFITFNAPTIVVPFCERHAPQICEEYGDLAEHLPKLTPDTTGLFPESNDAGSFDALPTPRPDESERRDDDEPEGAPRSADDR
ncbi:hypothetical protein ACFY9N_05795 [Microbacterium sp. NPDC008134]|uniref:hypothetical protein n=1 Tax=Microbacterium sp. NPDC008134 TaxID=3364183 RepID=UPI0036E36B6A